MNESTLSAAEVFSNTLLNFNLFLVQLKKQKKNKNMLGSWMIGQLYSTQIHVLLFTSLQNTRKANLRQAS